MAARNALQHSKEQQFRNERGYPGHRTRRIPCDSSRSENLLLVPGASLSRAPVRKSRAAPGLAEVARPGALDFISLEREVSAPECSCRQSRPGGFQHFTLLGLTEAVSRPARSYLCTRIR